MAIYAVGDIQGCYDEFQLLLDAIRFDQSADKLWLVGDLVNRGPKSLKTLRLIRSLGDAVICVLGNHDLHLLALALTEKSPTDDTDLRKILDAADCADLIEWLRFQPLAHYSQSINTLMVHAGVHPKWSRKQVLKYSCEVESVLRSKKPQKFLNKMYGRKPDKWSPKLEGNDRLRFIVNCLTRIRFCTPEGRLDFSNKLGPNSATGNLLPWFRAPKRKTENTRIVFGHWSTLGLMEKPGLLALDTGCVWGGALTAVQLDGAGVLIEVPSQQPKLF